MFCVIWFLQIYRKVKIQFLTHISNILIQSLFYTNELHFFQMCYVCLIPLIMGFQNIKKRKFNSMANMASTPHLFTSLKSSGCEIIRLHPIQSFEDRPQPKNYIHPSCSTLPKVLNTLRYKVSALCTYQSSVALINNHFLIYSI